MSGFRLRGGAGHSGGTAPESHRFPVLHRRVGPHQSARPPRTSRKQPPGDAGRGRGGEARARGRRPRTARARRRPVPAAPGPDARRSWPAPATGTWTPPAEHGSLVAGTGRAVGAWCRHLVPDAVRPPRQRSCRRRPDPGRVPRAAVRSRPVRTLLPSAPAEDFLRPVGRHVPDHGRETAGHGLREHRPHHGHLPRHRQVQATVDIRSTSGVGSMWCEVLAASQIRSRGPAMKIPPPRTARAATPSSTSCRHRCPSRTS